MAAHRTPRWTADEVAVLTQFYPHEGVECVVRLPHRSWKSVHQKAFKLGLRCQKITDAPVSSLQGEALEEAICLREDRKWSFARIGAHFGVSESAACNAVLIALCPRRGFTPAQRDASGRLDEEGLRRLRYALKKGLKAMDIQLRLGVSASCVAEQRRRYNRELRGAGKVPLPAAGAGQRYSGARLDRAARAEVEALFMTGLGTAKVSERSGVSKTSCTRIRTRLVNRLRRKGQTLPGCDAKGSRHQQAQSTRFIPDQVKGALRQMIRDRVPVRRAARQLAVGLSSAYRIRDELAADMAARGEELQPPVLPGRGVAGPSSDLHWPPQGARQIYAFRALLEDMDFDSARAQWKRERREERAAQAQHTRSFEEQLERIRRGEIGVAPALGRRHLDTTVMRPEETGPRS